MELWKLDCLGAIEPAEEAILREVKALGWLGVWLVGAIEERLDAEEESTLFKELNALDCCGKSEAFEETRSI